MTPAEEIAALKAENAALTEQMKALEAQLHELQARLAKDSHNSSKPPSSDGLGRKTKSLRRRSGKKAGGQLGHRGETLRLVAVPDAVVEHRPSVCASCQASLDDVDEAVVVLRERRQGRELPALRLVAREHQALHIRCPRCQAVSVGAVRAGARVARRPLRGVALLGNAGQLGAAGRGDAGAGGGAAQGGATARVGAA